MSFPGKKYVNRFWPLFFIAALFLLMFLFRISPRALWQTISGLKGEQVVFLLFMFAVISLCQILSRRYLLAAMGVPTKVRNLVYVHFCSMAAHHSTPAKIGFPMAVYLMKRLDQALQRWNQVYRQQDENLAIDGKTMCNAIDEQARQTHLMSVVGHHSKACYTQKKSGPYP